jgi:hypothetical protein
VVSLVADRPSLSPRIALLEDPQVADEASPNRPRAHGSLATFDEIQRDQPFIAGIDSRPPTLPGLPRSILPGRRIAIPPGLATLNCWRQTLAARPSAAA